MGARRLGLPVSTHEVVCSTQDQRLGPSTLLAQNFPRRRESCRHDGCLGINVEYPAPPAVANGIINGDPYLKSQAPKKRGGVISKIAERHAKEKWYGPKGGPYDENTIANDVQYFFGTCG